MQRQAGRGSHNRCGQVWPGVSQQVQGAGRQVDAGQDTGTGRCVQVSRHEHREVWAQGRGTWMWVGCKHKHKNKVKKKNHSSDSLHRQVGRGSHNRCGQAWSGVSWQAGVS